MPSDPQNDPVVSSMIIDRSPPIGNSLGPDARNRLHVKISNYATEPLPVTVVEAPIDLMASFFLDTDDTTTGAPQTLFSVVVPVATKRYLRQIKVSCRIELEWSLFIDATLVASGCCGPGHSDSVFEWIETNRIATAGSIIKLDIDSASTVAAKRVTSHLQASDGPG